MKRIRACELEISARYHEGKMRCPTHLSVGQEAVPAALQEILTYDDQAVSGHRAHAHYLCKGGNMSKMIAEIYGKETGCSKGKGGSMHLIDTDAGFIGSTAIVGGSIPIGVGLALANQLDKNNNITVIFLGDGAIETGAFYESANFAVLKNLAVLFICENNLYSVYTPLNKRQPANRKLTDVASGIGLNIDTEDGNNVEACYNLFNNIMDKMRQKAAPYFIELSTYRWLEHCGPHYDNDIGYRTVEEFEEWKKKDPIMIYIDMLIKHNKITNDIIKQIDESIKQEINDAFEFAENSPFPDISKAYSDLYAR